MRNILILKTLFKIVIHAGGGNSHLGGGGGNIDEDAKNSEAKTYTFVFIDKDGNRLTIKERGDTLKEAFDYAKIAARNKGFKAVKGGVVKDKSDEQASKHTTATEVKEQSGNVIDLTRTPLEYGKDALLSKRTRKNVDSFENSNYNSSKEKLAMFDSAGKKIGGGKDGSSTSVKTTDEALKKATTISHTHTAPEGEISGTFSAESMKEGDVFNFTEYGNIKNMRATGKEGTYNITKEKGFKAKDFRSAAYDESNKLDREANTMLSVYLSSGKHTDLEKQHAINVINNNKKVKMHNWYLTHQSTYGYSYTLERRKK